MIAVTALDNLGHFKNHWLEARYHFSFSGYRDPDRMGVGAGDVERHASEMESKIKAAHFKVKRVFIEAQSFAAHARQLPPSSKEEKSKP